MEEDKIYFLPGLTVRLKLDLPNSPDMLVVKKESSVFKHDDAKSKLMGIRCRWFTTNGLLLEAVFNTKDLILIK